MNLPLPYVRASLAAFALLLTASWSCSTSFAQNASGACQDYAELSTWSLTDSNGRLLRALSSTRAGRDGRSLLMRPSVDAIRVCADSLPFLTSGVKGRPGVGRAVQVAPLRVLMESNSAYPRDHNNGAMWAGKGLNTAVSAGVRVRRGIFEATVLPTFIYQQNADHEFVRSTAAGRSEFAHPDHHGIDFPKRHGLESFTTFDVGQTMVRATWRGVTASLSNENLWLGANQVYPILLSNTAPGFPHMRFSTRPINLGLVNAEVHLFGGELSESDYYDFDAANNTHYFTGTLITLEPRALPGLHVAITRVYHDTASIRELSPGTLIRLTVDAPFYAQGGNRNGNGIGAVFLRWVLPESGFEVYGEWSREDTPYNLSDLLREPDWTQAFGAGLQKVFLSRNRLTRLYGEYIHLGEAAPVRGGEGFFSYYTHGKVPQGHTQRGQLLGASIGPGSDAQLVGWETFGAASRTGVRLERTRYDEDTYYRRFARRFGEARHELELTGEISRTQMISDFTIDARVRISRRWDRDFITLRAELPAAAENNVGVELTGTWQLRW